MSDSSARRESLAVAALLAMTAIWGTTFILVKWTVASVDVYLFLLLRSSVALLALSAIFFRRLTKVRPATVLSSLALSALMFVAFVVQTEGLRFTTASNAALITGMYMVLIPFFAIIYPRTRPGIASVAGIMLATPGLWLLTGFSAAGLNPGDLLMLICAAAWAWHIILTGRFSRRHDIVQLVVFQLVFVTIMNAAAVVVTGARIENLPPVGWLTVAVTGLFATALAFTVQTWAQRIVDHTRVGIVFAMEAVFGALFGWWLGGETMTVLAFAGACLMVAGMLVSEMRPLAKYAMDRIVG